MRTALAVLVFCFASILSRARAEESLPNHAPRVYGVTAGAAYVVSNRLPLGDRPRSLHPWGATLGLRSGWQVGGLQGGAPATLGFEMDVLYQSEPAARTSYAMIYGVFIKHALSARLRVRPFVSYGLGAAQVWVQEVSGRGIGHATRIAFGLDARVGERRHLTLALTYQGIIMPRFALAETRAIDTSFQSIVLSTGFWYGN